jgi:hypothetical protein
MPTKPMDLRCPKCKKSGIKVASQADYSKALTCAHCGRTSKIGEFLTPSGKSLLDQTAKTARDRLKSVKGFKPSS